MNAVMVFIFVWKIDLLAEVGGGEPDEQPAHEDEE